MSESFKIFLTSVITIFGSIFVYVVGKIVSRFFIESIHKQTSIIGKIDYSLSFYANIYGNPGQENQEYHEKTSKELRQLACELIEKTNMIWGYNILGFLRIVPLRKKIFEVSSNLIELSNSIIRGDADRNVDLRDNIRELLNMKHKIGRNGVVYKGVKP